MKLLLRLTIITIISCTTALSDQSYTRDGKAVDLSGVQIPDLTGQELKPGYGIPFQPTVTPDFQEQAEQKREQEKYQKENAPDLSELVSLTVKETWLVPIMYRWYKRNTQSQAFHTDSSFFVNDEMLDGLPVQYSLENRSYLRESKSREEFTARLAWANEDMELKQAAEAYGAKNILIKSLAFALDPPKLVVILLVFLLTYKRAIQLPRALMETGRVAAVYSLLFGIRGARTLKGAINNFWNEVKEADRGTSENTAAKTSRAEQIKPEE
ncbi:MAG: hypothetical protein AB7U43_11380 [Desulfobacter sp.]